MGGGPCPPLPPPPPLLLQGGPPVRAAPPSAQRGSVFLGAFGSNMVVGPPHADRPRERGLSLEGGALLLGRGPCCWRGPSCWRGAPSAHPGSACLGAGVAPGQWLGRRGTPASGCFQFKQGGGEQAGRGCRRGTPHQGTHDPSRPSPPRRHPQVKILAGLRHPHVVLFMGVTVVPCCIVTEFCARGE